MNKVHLFIPFGVLIFFFMNVNCFATCTTTPAQYSQAIPAVQGTSGASCSCGQMDATGTCATTSICNCKCNGVDTHGCFAVDYVVPWPVNGCTPPVTAAAAIPATLIKAAQTTCTPNFPVSGAITVAPKINGSQLTGQVQGSLLTGQVQGSLLTGQVQGSLLTGSVAGSLITGPLNNGSNKATLLQSQIITGSYSGGNTCNDPSSSSTSLNQQYASVYLWDSGSQLMPTDACTGQRAITITVNVSGGTGAGGWGCGGTKCTGVLTVSLTGAGGGTLSQSQNISITDYGQVHSYPFHFTFYVAPNSTTYEIVLDNQNKNSAQGDNFTITSYSVLVQ